MFNPLSAINDVYLVWTYTIILINPGTMHRKQKMYIALGIALDTNGLNQHFSVLAAWQRKS